MQVSKIIDPLKVIFLVLSHLVVFFCSAQNNGNEQVKRLQRGIMVYNIAQQVQWPENAFNTFKIGVLGPDRASIDFQALAQKRQVSGKTVEVVRFNKVKNIEGIQLLYVNRKYNYQMDYILSSLSGRNILLVSEDYNYHTSMINIVSVGDSFSYEINEDLLLAENFSVAPTLKKFAVSSSEKWKQLYKTTQTELTTEQERVATQSEIIEANQELIEDKDVIIERSQKIITASKELVNEQEDTISELTLKNEIQLAKYQDKVLVERELQETIEKQLDFLKEQETAISKSSKLLTTQQETLQEQEAEIKNNKDILKAKDDVIVKQRLINILLVCLALVLLVAGLLVYRNYLAKRELSLALSEKNAAFEVQAKSLEQKNNELEQFAYIASHDLQEPLNSITSLISILKSDYDPQLDEVGKQSLQYMEDSTVRMRSLIKALLKHSKLGGMEAKETVHVGDLMKEIQLDLSEVIETSGATIECINLPIVEAAKVELRLVFQNLISNAIKFTAPDVVPKIHISASKDESQKFWQFSIADNGIGIPKLYQERIFAIFQRLHNKDKYEGTGIGLAHVKKIIDAHDGSIWLESTEGEGSTFYFTLPV